MCARIDSAPAVSIGPSRVIYAYDELGTTSSDYDLLYNFNRKDKECFFESLLFFCIRSKNQVMGERSAYSGCTIEAVVLKWLEFQVA